MRLHFQTWTIVLAAGSLAAVTVRSQTISLVPNAGTNQVIALHPITPIQYFRELLAMKPADREKALVGKSEEQKRKLLAKIQEYEMMPVGERELRLQHTELRWYMIRLMPLSPVERLAQLSTIPFSKRALIEERLQKWDQVPLPLQKELLDNEAMIQRILAWEATPVEQRRGLSPIERDQINKELAHWHGLPTDQRQRMVENFRQFFELNNSQKKDILGTLSESERQQMEQTLQKFSSLAAAQREKCIESFVKFTGMSADERTEFLKNAQRWEAMTSRERQAWRDVVNKLPPMPPMPPGVHFAVPPPIPPLPPQRISGLVTATNGSNALSLP